jgi:hypothetical protein
MARRESAAQSELILRLLAPRLGVPAAAALRR